MEDKCARAMWAAIRRMEALVERLEDSAGGKVVRRGDESINPGLIAKPRKADAEAQGEHSERVAT